MRCVFWMFATGVLAIINITNTAAVLFIKLNLARKAQTAANTRVNEKTWFIEINIFFYSSMRHICVGPTAPVERNDFSRSIYKGQTKKVQVR